jgi:hypothetical protein
MPVLGDGAVRRPDRDPEHQPDRAARSHVHEHPHDLARLDPGKRGGPALPAWKAAAGSSNPSACADHRHDVGLMVPYLAAPSGTWRARSWPRRPRPSAGGIVAATCGRAGRLVRPGGLGLRLAPDTYLPSKTEYPSAPIICVNGSRAKAARAANPVKEPITQRHRKESLHVPDLPADYFAEPVIGNRTVKDAPIRFVRTRLAVSVPSRSRISSSIAPRRSRRHACPGLSDGCPARRPGQARSAALFQLATGLPAVVLPACWRIPRAARRRAGLRVLTSSGRKRSVRQARRGTVACQADPLEAR